MVLERQLSDAKSLIANVASLSFLERYAFGAMQLVADVGSLSFLEQYSSGASHWCDVNLL